MARNDTPQDPKRWWQRNPSSDWSIVGLTAVLALISFFQWKVTRDTLEISSRAYLAVKDATILRTRPTSTPQEHEIDRGPGLKLSNAPVIDVVVTNGGATPAVEVSVLAAGLIVLNAPPLVGHSNALPSTPSAVESLGKNVIAKDGEQHIGFRPNAVYSDEEIKRVRDEKTFLVVHGTVGYRDIFGKMQGLEFCYRYNAGIDDMVPCASHNRLY